MLDFRKKIFNQKCLKIPKNNFKLGPKLIFEKKILFGPQVVPCENDKNLKMSKNDENLRKIFLTKSA